MQSAPFDQLKAEKIVLLINQLQGQPLFKVNDTMTIERAFVFPYKARIPIFNIFQTCSAAGKSLSDILLDTPEYYSEFDVAVEYREGKMKNPSLQFLQIN